MCAALEHRVPDSCGLLKPRILIISPVRNEAAHIERVVRAVAAQELRPERWIVLDDNSTDGTRELLESLAREVPFMEVRGVGTFTPHAGARDRLARAAAPRNFNMALGTTDWRDYTHIMKLDGDIELGPAYLRVLLERFGADPQLGLAGGVLIEPLPEGMRRLAIPRHHVHGALKCYSRACFEAIGGVQERLGWDTIDETYARMRGFTTLSFEDLVSVHHRPWGSADGALRGLTRLGECAYITHYPPSWVGLRSVKLAADRRRPLVGLAYMFGYVRAFARRRDRVQDTAYRRFTRRELRGRLLAMLTRRKSQTVVAA
jgi:glycosyltransferase involved in cell wall biosynthesis